VRRRSRPRPVRPPRPRPPRPRRQRQRPGSGRRGHNHSRGSTFDATINDSQVSRDFLATLPTTLTWDRNAGIEYITELDAPLTETGPYYTDVEAGDIVYYNPRDSITIIYAPTSSVSTLTKPMIIGSWPWPPAGSLRLPAGWCGRPWRHGRSVEQVNSSLTESCLTYEDHDSIIVPLNQAISHSSDIRPRDDQCRRSGFRDAQLAHQ
jgi:hypothetical protein